MRAWFPKGKTPIIKDPGRHEKLSVFGAYNKNDDRIIITTSTYFNAVAFKRFINHLLDRVKLKQKKILLIVDNARYHRAKELKDFFYKIKDKLELFFLPPYSPDLNLIETEWRETRRNATHNRYFETDELKRQALFSYWNKKKNTRSGDIFTAFT